MKSITEKLDNGYYNVEIPSPIKPNSHCDECDAYVRDDHKFCPTCGTKSTYEEKLKIWRKELNVHRVAQREKYKLMKDEMLEDVGLKGHPKAEKAWSFINEHLNSSYKDMYFHLEELATLML